jgi:hypothetical protein
MHLSNSYSFPKYKLTISRENTYTTIKIIVVIENNERNEIYFMIIKINAYEFIQIINIWTLVKYVYKI